MSEQRDHKRQSGFPVMMGGSSLLVIFAVLCLTVFALLSLSTVLADKRLADASAEAVSAYYEADCRAEEIFAKLRCGRQLPEGVRREGDQYMYTCVISDTQALWVELQADGGSWTVLRWQAVPQTQIRDAQLEVWDGKTRY